MRKGLSSLYYAALSALLGLIAGLLGTFVSNQQIIPQHKLVIFYHFGIVLCVVAFIAIFLSALTYDLVNSKKEAQEQERQANERISQAEQMHFVETIVPKFIRMSERIDKFTVQEDTVSVRLEWNFTLQTILPEEINTLTFPIYADIYTPEQDESRIASSVKIEKVTINSQDVNVSNCYVPMELRRPHPAGGQTGPLVEQGILSVPVSLKRGPDRCSIQIVMTIQGAYQKSLDQEYVVVDIPYLTEKLSVNIVAPQGYRILKGSSFPVEAVISEMRTTDIAETYDQSRLLQFVGGNLAWNTKLPKLGYRYKIYFKIEPENLAGTGPSASSH